MVVKQLLFSLMSDTSDKDAKRNRPRFSFSAVDPARKRRSGVKV